MVYSWRVGYKINIDYENIVEERSIICIAYKWQHEKKVHALRWVKRGDDKAMLREFSKIIESADEVVAHNGDKFDIPWLRARAAIHRIPLSPYIKSIDTKAQSARNFYFNSNRMNYLGIISGVGPKIKTDFDLWKSVMDGDETALDKMVRYCKRDVKILEGVFLWLEDYNKPKTHVGVLHGGEKDDCPKCGSVNTKRRGQRIIVTAMGSRRLEKVCNDCGRRFHVAERAVA